MKLKTKIIIAFVVYVAFMVAFMGWFLPRFTEMVNGNEMIDSYLVDYGKSLLDIENLIMDYGEVGRNYGVNFFIWDSAYVVISTILFSLLIRGVTQNKKLSYIPLASGLFDTIENLVVLYTVNTLNMNYIGIARFFATAKAVVLVIIAIIIIVGAIKMIRGKLKENKS